MTLRSIRKDKLFDKTYKYLLNYLSMERVFHTNKIFSERSKSCMLCTKTACKNII